MRTTTRMLWVGLVTAVLLFPRALLAEPAQQVNKNFDVDTRKYILDNGLTVLISSMPASTTVSVYALAKTGSAVEDKYLGSGMSHFLEHMLFKGTQRRGVGEISREVQALGGNINASTGFDHTIYTLTVPADKFAQGLDIIADMVMNSRFDPAEIDKEREVVYSEIGLYRDRPDRYLSELLFSTVYQHHPYGVPVIGYEDLLKQLKRDDFFDYYRRRYAPNNMVLSIAGKVDPDQALARVKERFKDFPRQSYFIRNLIPEPVQVTPRRYEETYATELTRLSLAFGGVSLLDQDMFALDVLAMALGQGETSRLYQALFVKQRLVKAIDASNFTPVDRGFFNVDAILDHQDIDRVVDSVLGQIALVQKKGLAPEELEKTKRQILSQYIQGKLTSADIAYSTAVDEAAVGDYAFSRKYVEAVRRVGNDDIKRVAVRYLTRDQLSIVVLKPRSADGEVVAAKPAVESETQRIVLQNGLVLLLKEDHRAPLVAVTLALNGGVGQESAQLNGISELMARLWARGTASRTGDEIAREVESRGMSAGGFSGRNSFGLRINMMSDDTAFGLDLLEDLVKNAVFDEEEIGKEKEKLQTEIMARDDNIGKVAGRALREELFSSHPFRLDPIGTRESVERIRRKDILDVFRRFVSPQNMVLAVSGDFQAGPMAVELKKRFSGLTPAQVDLVESREAPPEQTRTKDIFLDKKQAMVMIGLQAPDFRDKDYFPVEVLTAILGSPFSGRIFDQVREQLGGAYTLGGNYNAGRDTGMVYFHVLTSEENLPRVQEMLGKILDDIRTMDVSDRELMDIKSYLKGDFQMGIETPAALGFMSALDEVYGRGHDFYQSYDRHIDAVTKEDIRRVAGKYLDVNHAAVVRVQPRQAAGAEPVPDQVVQP